ncbi:hypothetical protein B0H19DRAFT_1277168 [Mycena capillaripes]|nr:hypothetical protein B0H19DRAFT_1277168 [Mycena capillaripes]
MGSDSGSHADDELSSDESSPENFAPGSSSLPPRYPYPANRHSGRLFSSGMFSSAHDFTLTARNLTNITNNYGGALNLPADFRMIPVGDIYLLWEIRLDNDSGIVGRQHERKHIRRMYTARVDGHESSMTVAVYQGAGAEEEWRQDVAKYMSLRHPNIIQIRAGASSGGIHATIFHEDLIPLKEFLDLHRHSPIVTAYIKGYCGTAGPSLPQSATNSTHEDADEYVFFTVGEILLDCKFSIRRTTGRLCVDLATFSPWYRFPFLIGAPPRVNFLNASNKENMIIDYLTPAQYHDICGSTFSQANFWASTLSAVNLGAVISRASSKTVWEIATLQDPRIPYGNRWHQGAVNGTVTENGWNRFDSNDLSTISISWWFGSPAYWLSQASYIFNRLKLESAWDNHCLVIGVQFCVKLSQNKEDAPASYLFLCAVEDLQTGPSSFAPDPPAYWSLDPSGTERLSMEDARNRGFPIPQFCTNIHTKSWDDSVYVGLRQFHRAKGFDPDTQDVARHLGYPLYQVSSQIIPLFPHIDEAPSEADDDSQFSPDETFGEATHGLPYKNDGT